MYCNNCHYSLIGNENYCPNCGQKISNELILNNPDSKSTENYRSASIVLGIIGITGIFFGILAPISLILSIVGLILAIKSNKNVKNTPGIVLNAIALVISFIITTIIALIIIFSFNVIKEYWQDIIPEVETDIEHGDF